MIHQTRLSVVVVALGTSQLFLKVARLQSEFCTKEFFRATNFVTKNAPKFSPNFLSLCSVGQKNSRKIPSKFPTKSSKFPCETLKKKIHRRASAGAQGELFQSHRPLSFSPRSSASSPLGSSAHHFVPMLPCTSYSTGVATLPAC